MAHAVLFEGGPRFVSGRLGDYGAIGVGAHYAIDVVRDRMTYVAELDLAKVWLTSKNDEDLPDPVPGVMARVGVDARWIFAEGGEDDFWIGGWVQGGVGVHAIQWLDGGRLAHPDVQLGIGLSEIVGRDRLFSFEPGVNVVFGRTDMKGLPTCAGPCDQPTPPVSTEVGITIDMAFAFRW
ncbi:MAG TPA: hypothetical protein VL463_14065 [Kofleriaceae bacterium]|nr:hypothetical protein [Kofleriaceae bacterium]